MEHSIRNKCFIFGFILCVFCCLPGNLFPQTAKLDRLRIEFQNIKGAKDSIWVDLCNSLSWEYHTINLDSAVYFAKEAQKQAENIGYKVGMARAYNLLGLVASLRNDEDSQERWNNMGLPLAEMSEDSFVKAVIYNDLANIYASRNENAKALNFYHNALRYTTKNDDVGTIITVGNIALLHSSMGNFDLAKSYLDQNIQKIANTKDPYVKCVAYLSKADYYYAIQALDSTILYCQKAFDIAKKTENFLIEVQCLNFLAKASKDQGHYEHSYEYLEQAIKLSDQKGYKYLNSDITYSLGKLYLAEKDFDNVIRLMNSAIEKLDPSSSNHLNYLKDYYGLLAIAYAGMEHYNDAYFFQTKEEEIKDSLYTLAQGQKVTELEIQYELEKKEIENSLLRSRQIHDSMRVKYHRTLNWAMFIFLSLTFVIVCLVWVSLKQKQRFAEQLQIEVSQKTADLQLKNEELEGFAHIVSHDLKEPLRNIISFVNLIERRFEDLNKEELATYFSFIKKSSNQLYNLVEDVLQFSKLGKVTTAFSLIDTAKIIKEAEKVLQPKIEEKNANITTQGIQPIHCSEAMLFLIFKNLLDNGITYNRSETPQVNISYELKNSQHCFMLSDNGIGIPAEFKEKVFKMFFRLHNRNEFEGTGLGLAIVKKLVDQLKGEIYLESEKSGTTFFIKLPIQDEATTI
ncbi:MAG: ATP-binding protein [Saprospiraceae bacterium]